MLRWKVQQSWSYRIGYRNGYSDRLPKFVVGKSKNQDVLKALKVCLVDTVLNTKAGCLQNFFKNGYRSSIESLLQLKGRMP